MNKKVILSADSTCDLGEELQARYHVNYTPYHISLEDQDYLDNVTISAEQIYQAYWDKKLLPKTSAINIAEYIEYFKPWVEEGYEVVHINLGGALSTSHKNCLLAAQELGNVYPVDSCSLSTGSGLQVIKAAELIEQGKSAAEIAEELRGMTGRTHASFILGNLEFMHAGGRCSAITKLGANLLGLKPCIEVDNESGAMGVGKKYRGKLEDVLVKYTQDKLNAYPDILRDHIFITHAGVEQKYIDLVRQTIESTMDFQEIHLTRASCTISCHCGPNTIGVLFVTEHNAK